MNGLFATNSPNRPASLRIARRLRSAQWILRFNMILLTCQSGGLAIGFWFRSQPRPTEGIYIGVITCVLFVADCLLDIPILRFESQRDDD